MATAQHTPGPWHIVGDLVLNLQQQMIAVVGGEREGLLGSPAANGRLIAAAPELLAAVKHLRACLELSRKMLTGEFRKNPHDIDALEDRVRQYEPLIAEAEGK